MGPRLSVGGKDAFAEKRLHRLDQTRLVVVAEVGLKHVLRALGRRDDQHPAKASAKGTLCSRLLEQEREQRKGRERKAMEKKAGKIKKKKLRRERGKKSKGRRYDKHETRSSNP